MPFEISALSWSWPPRVQVAGVASLQEALFCARVGVDALGFTLELPTGIHDGLTPEKTRLIIQHSPANILPVVITYLDTATDAARLVNTVRAGAVQFHGEITDAQIERFRADCPGVKTIGRITVTGSDAALLSDRFRQPLWDAVILDSLDPETGHIGATGLTHDWSLSRQIVRRSHVPVILAGGLNPRNVAQAIATARPHGVDAHTGLENYDGSRNFSKIRAFAEAALQAFATSTFHVP
jgi:phosphoribosylanthranilate isomerase